MLGKQLLKLSLCREQTPDQLIKIANVIPKKKGLQLSQRKKCDFDPYQMFGFAKFGQQFILLMIIITIHPRSKMRLEQSVRIYIAGQNMYYLFIKCSPILYDTARTTLRKCH